MDLSDPASFTALEAKLAEEKPEVRLLINNAGFGISGAIEIYTNGRCQTAI